MAHLKCQAHSHTSGKPGRFPDERRPERDLRDLLQTKRETASMSKMSLTTGSLIATSYYGYQVHPISGERTSRTGVDIPGCRRAQEILAGHDGTVTLAENASGYGLCVAIEGEAYEGHTLTTKYRHCSQILVSPPGRRSKAGDVIARSNTGNSPVPTCI